MHPVSDSVADLALLIARAAEDRKATDIRVLQVEEVCYLADYFVIVSGFSVAQLRAIAKAVEEQVLLACGRRPARREGAAETGWVLLDYGDVIVHIFLPKQREFYNLEMFWSRATPVPLPEAAIPATS